MWPNAKVCVMGPDQLASVMQTVSGNRHSDDADARFAELRTRIEKESEALYSTARLWDDGIIQPRDTRDVLGLAIELAADEKASRPAGSGGSRGEIGADGDSGDWGVFRM
jgi:3-methylcrotonyl-CoA carboxylase beta subunit